MSSLPIFAGSCIRCGKSRSYRDMVGNDAEGYMCHECYYNNSGVMLALSMGLSTPGCVECGRNMGQIKTYTGDTRLFIHFIDGGMRTMCKPCSDNYVKKVPNYKNTRFGWDKKLRGYK